MSELPEFSEFGIAAIKLLQGVVYQEDKDVWAILLANESEIEAYFCRIGTNVVIDRSNGLAYLKQFSDDQRVDGYERLPRLITRTPLSYQVRWGVSCCGTRIEDLKTKTLRTKDVSSKPRRSLTAGSLSFHRKKTMSLYARS